MTRREVAVSLILAIPIAAAGLLTGARTMMLPPPANFSCAEGAYLTHELSCDAAPFDGWIEVRFDAHVVAASSIARLSNGQPLLLANEPDGWVRVTAPGPPKDQPKFFALRRGIRVLLRLNNAAAVINWRVNRENLPADSASAEAIRWVSTWATILFVFLSSAAVLAAPRLLAADENVSPERLLRMIINGCEMGDRKQTRYARKLLRATAIDGLDLRFAADRFLPYDARKRKTFAIRAVMMLKQRVDHFHDELARVSARLSSDRHERRR